MTTECSNRSERDEQAAQACQEHLRVEENLLVAISQSLQDVRAALLRGDWSVLPTLLAFQKRLIEDERNLVAARERLRQELAILLGVSLDSVTVRGMARTLPATLAKPVLEHRERILGLAREAEALRRANAALLGYSLDFSRNLLRGLTGQEVPERYGPGGKRQVSVSPCLIQGRG